MILTYQSLNIILRSIFYHQLLDNNLISIQMLPNIFLPDLEIDKDEKTKNSVSDFCNFCEKYSFDKNLLEKSNISDKIFSNKEKKEKLMLVSEKT